MNMFDTLVLIAMKPADTDTKQLCFFEGGDFDYLRRAYGPQAAFSFAWFNFFISKTGSQVWKSR